MNFIRSGLTSLLSFLRFVKWRGLMRLHFILLISILFFIFNSANSKNERHWFYAKDASEAIMKLPAVIIIDSERKPSIKTIHDKIEQQVQHLFGPMSFNGEIGLPTAVPKGDHEIKIKENSLKKIELNKWEIQYIYKGTVLAEKTAGSKWDAILPINPDEIYSRARKTSTSYGLIRCTDSHYQSKGDFWYFWSPDRYGCKLEEGRDYKKFQAELERTNNTRTTYPEYDRLIQNENGKKIVSIYMFNGMDDPSLSKNPYRSTDINAANYVSISSDLKSRKYKLLDTLKDHEGGGQIEIFQKERNHINTIVYMFFGPTGINEGSSYFHKNYKKGLETGSVIIYNGHSGLGGHLHLDYIEYYNNFKIKPPKDQYQIYYFNSCSSYPYYNEMYFNPKITTSDPRGTENLDILTNGLSTAFVVIDSTTINFIQAIDHFIEKGSAITFQNIVDKGDTDNLFGVNGDEDNPKNPPINPYLNL